MAASARTNAEDVLAYRAAKAAGNGAEARRLQDKIVRANRGFIIQIVKREMGVRAKQDADLEESIQEGTLGLLRALETFDPTKAAFSTYAGWWIRAFVQREARRQQDTTKSRHEKIPASVAKAMNQHRLKHGKEATAEDLGVDQETLTKWLTTAEVVFAEDLAGTEDGRGGISSLSDDSPNAEELLGSVNIRPVVRSALAELSPRNQELVTSLYWEGLTSRAVAERFGISRQRVEEIVKGFHVILKAHLKRAGYDVPRVA